MSEGAFESRHGNASRKPTSAADSLTERVESRPGAATDPGSTSDFTSVVVGRLARRGEVFGRYELEDEVGRGGQGTVLRVWDEDLQRHLAMKVHLGKGEPGSASPGALADSRALGRFLEEAQVTGQLDHPGIVPVHELGLDSEGRAYFTMKLVKGRSLKEVFELVRDGEEGWTRARALGVIQKVCEAMAYAHAKGVIHRDLKPGNVMVGKYGEVFVMDWGLARVLGRADDKDIRVQPLGSSTEIHTRRDDASDPESPLFTMDGHVLGTPAYMSPEQARGDTEEMGPPSDVYAVGAMLYQLLAGHMPYVKPGTRPSSRMIVYQVQGGPPDSLLERAPDAPPALVAICEKAMAREIPDRYRDMSELAEDLSAFLENRVVRAYETGAIAELRRWTQRNRALASSLAAVIVLALVGLGGISYVQAEGKRAAESARNQAQENERIAERRRDAILRLRAFQDLEDLQRRAAALWPPHPEHVASYRDWLEDARALVAGLEPNPAAGDIGHRAQLARLEARAREASAEEQEQARRAHPRHGELARRRAELEARRNAQAVREGRAALVEPPLEGPALPADTVEAAELNALAMALVDPARTSHGGEARGLALARLALERVQDDQTLARVSETLAWALFANGADEEAAAEMAAAVSLAPSELRGSLASSQRKLMSAVEAARAGGRAALADLERLVAELEAEVSAHRVVRFEDENDTWWHGQLTKLLDEIRAFSDPETGLIEGISPAHGWGIERRLAFAATIEERSVSGERARQLWREAAASIADPERCPAYRGLVVEPQLGLLPIGRDPRSGLWEFAHLLSGEPAVRGEDGELVLTEETGIVLVLLPGGTFWMGAQSLNPDGPSYDPVAEPASSPVHEVMLSPFFLSRYEVTQGQWLRLTGRNPSYYQPPDPGAPTLLHPVEQVSWYDCMEFCRRTGLALPSEAQWEYGARGGTTSVWWSGDERESLVGAVNLADRAAARGGFSWAEIGDWPELDDGAWVHAPVHAYTPNPFGLHNVYGNVWEWVLDGFDLRFYARSPRVDPVADPADPFNPVRRGGSFNDATALARSALRDYDAPEIAAAGLGFRPARPLTP